MTILNCVILRSIGWNELFQFQFLNVLYGIVRFRNWKWQFSIVSYLSPLGEMNYFNFNSWMFYMRSKTWISWKWHMNNTWIHWMKCDMKMSWFSWMVSVMSNLISECFIWDPKIQKLKMVIFYWVVLDSIGWDELFQFQFLNVLYGIRRFKNWKWQSSIGSYLIPLDEMCYFTFNFWMSYMKS